MTLRHTDQEAMSHMTQHFKDDEAKHQAAFDVQKQQADGVISDLKRTVQSLQKANSDLESKLKQTELQVQSDENKTQQVEAKLTAEHQAFLSVKTAAAEGIARLAKDRAETTSLKAEVETM